jgi:hypothetical protein
MADIRVVVNSAIDLAKIAGTVLPGVAGGAVAAEKILDMLDSLKSVAPNQASEIEETHEQLYKRVTDAGHALSDRLRG